MDANDLMDAIDDDVTRARHEEARIGDLLARRLELGESIELARAAKRAASDRLGELHRERDGLDAELRRLRGQTDRPARPAIDRDAPALVLFVGGRARARCAVPARCVDSAERLVKWLETAYRRREEEGGASGASPSRGPFGPSPLRPWFDKLHDAEEARRVAAEEERWRLDALNLHGRPWPGDMAGDATVNPPLIAPR